MVNLHGYARRDHSETHRDLAGIKIQDQSSAKLSSSYFESDNTERMGGIGFISQ